MRALILSGLKLLFRNKGFWFFILVTPLASVLLLNIHQANTSYYHVDESTLTELSDPDYKVAYYGGEGKYVIKVYDACGSEYSEFFLGSLSKSGLFGIYRVQASGMTPEDYSERTAFDGENDRMGGLVKQLLDLSRAENAKTPAEMENTDFSRLVTGEALAFESVAFESGKTLRTSVEDGICLAGNPSQLTQLVSILLDNAVRHSAGSDILLELCRSGRTACLRTVNDSEELPKETLEHLFDRFYQADEARSSEGKHYGLGLSIAKAVSENHGGTISAACENGKIIFTVTLPLQN